MKKLFGTDGIRGIANTYPLTIDTCLKLGKALHTKFLHNCKNPVILIGKDTRISGDIFEYALASVFVSLGVEVKLLGVIPTPAVSILMKKWNANFGIVISASHNPYYDNGIKLFNSEGLKLNDSEEIELENLIFEDIKVKEAQDKEICKVVNLHNQAIDEYILDITKELKINGSNIKVVIDSANGALSNIATKVFRQFGFNIITLANNPDGININENCGVTHPETLQKAVLQHSADLGIAFDGDGDRVLLCDEKGQVLDGDEILAILSIENESKEIVSTIMSNFGFEQYLKERNIKLIRTNVGDKHVSEYMRQSNAVIGGEPSGHIIIKSHAPTGDGLFSGLKVIESVLKKREKFSQQHLFIPCPVVQKNIKVKDKSVIKNQKVQQIIQAYQNQLTDTGRLIVRPSGTEPLIRISAEGNNLSVLNKIVADIEEVIEQC